MGWVSGPSKMQKVSVSETELQQLRLTLPLRRRLFAHQTDEIMREGQAVIVDLGLRAATIVLAQQRFGV